MDLKIVKQRAKDGKPVKWRNKCWYITSIDEELKTVSMRDLPFGYRGTMITLSQVPITELRRAYQRRAKTQTSKD